LNKVKPVVTRKILNSIYEDSLSKYGTAKKYIKRESGATTPDLMSIISPIQLSGSVAIKFRDDINNMKTDEKSFNQEVIPDLVLVSPRHLFRMPYSLHEKTALASIVLKQEEIEKFEMMDADPMKLSKENIRNFMPNSKEGEASELLVQALDWYRENNTETVRKEIDFKPIKIDKILEANFPPCVKNILKGISDGKKRALFILINLFRSVGMDKDELEKRIYEWNKKNEVPLKEGYIQTQLSWAYRKKPIMPPNCMGFYEGIGVCQPDDFCKLIKNPVNYLVRKSTNYNKQTNKKKENKKNFDNQ
jgi:hypothetical protein